MPPLCCWRRPRNLPDCLSAHDPLRERRWRFLHRRHGRSDGGHNIDRDRLLAFNAVKKLLRNDRSLCLRLHRWFRADQPHAAGGQSQDEQADHGDVAQQLLEGLHRAATESRGDRSALTTAPGPPAEPRRFRGANRSRNWNARSPLALTGMVRSFAAIGVLVLLSSSAWADWGIFADSRGSSVQYPREVFSVPAGSGEPPGPMLQSADGRARLHVFTRPNERRASPSEFIRRAVTDQGERLSYKRVTDRFLVFSAAQGDLILYRRCNFVAAGIHCFDVRYPRAEKRAWDGPVTRMSFSLRPR